MNSWLHQVPTMAILNARIIGMIANETNVQHAAKACGVGGHYPLINVAFLTGLMYSILVVPKELFSLSDKRGKRPTDPSITGKQADLTGLQKDIESLQLDKHLEKVLTKNEDYKKNPSREVVRLLRNSVAHVNYEITGTPPMYSVCFWNMNNQGEKTWEATCPVDKLQSLLVALGEILHNYYHSAHHA